MQLDRTIYRQGEDWIIHVSGGKAHVGSVVLAQPYFKDGKLNATANTLNVLSHKDDLVAEKYAKALCQATGHTAVCICGIHFDDFNPEVLKAVEDWVCQDIAKMLEEADAFGKIQ